MTTKEKPSKFDCYANAKPDEPMFILLGRDPCAGLLVRFWCMLRIAMDLGNEDQINEAFECAGELDQWAKGLGKEALISKLITLVNEMQPEICPKTKPFEPPFTPAELDECQCGHMLMSHNSHCTAVTRTILGKPVEYCTCTIFRNKL